MNTPSVGCSQQLTTRSAQGDQVLSNRGIRGATGSACASSRVRTYDAYSPSVYASMDGARRTCIPRFVIQTPSSCSKNVNLSRKMNDPIVKTEAIRTILRFLTVRGLPDHVTTADLQSPTRQIYVLIMEFLMLQYDGTLRMRMPDEDIPKFFKDIGCPMTITKSAIKAPGTPTTWPTLLTAMTWLCELLLYDEAVISPETSESTSTAMKNAPLNGLFSQAVLSGYRMIMNDEVDNATVDNDLRTFCTSEAEVVKCQLKDLQEKLDASTTLIEHYKQRLREAAELTAKNAKLEEDALKLQQLAEKCELNVQETIASNVNKATHVTELKSRLESLNAENAELQSIVSRQEMNIIEVQHVEAQMQQRREMLQNAQKERLQTQDEAMQYEKQAENSRRRLRTAESEILASQRTCKDFCESPTKKKTFDGVTIKVIKQLRELCLAIDDLSLDGHLDKKLTAEKDRPQTVGKPVGPIRLTPKTLQYGDDALAKSTPACIDRNQCAGQSYGAGSNTDTYENTKGSLTDLMGLEWKECKNFIQSVITTESASAMNMAQREEECKRQQKAVQEKIVGLQKAQTGESDRLRQSEMEREQMTKRHQRKIRAVKEDIENVKEQTSNLQIDLSERIKTSQQHAENQSKSLKQARNESKVAVNEAKKKVIKMAQEILECKKLVENKVARLCEEQAVMCRVHQETASVAFRFCADQNTAPEFCQQFRSS